MSEKNFTNDGIQQDKAIKLATLRDSLMQRVDERVAPTGIFHWSYLMPHALAQCNGSPGAPPINQRLFRDFYHELATGSLPSVKMASIDDVDKLAAAHHEEGIIPIAIADYHYTTARDRFVASLLRHVDEDTPFEIPSDVSDAEAMKDVVEERHAFFASAILKQIFLGFTPEPVKHYGLDARFKIPTDCYFTNSKREFMELEIDLDDGTGWRPLPLDKEVTTSYASTGTKQISLRGQTDKGELSTSFILEVHGTKTPNPNEIWVFNGIFDDDGRKVVGHAWVFYGTGHDKLTAPVLIAEGFPGNYPLEYLWEKLNAHNLAENLRASGKDIVIVGFNEGTLGMELNAGVMIAAINTSISKLQTNKTSPHLIVGGASMGGVVARYALTYMEKNNMPHYTEKYFSIDSPHTGAYVPLSVQLFADYFARHSTGANDVKILLQTRAAQELLLFWWDSINKQLNNPQSPRRTAFVDDLNALGGYPKLPKKIGVASGAGDGKEIMDNGIQALYYSGGCVGVDLRTAPGSSDDNNDWLFARLAAGTKWEYFDFSDTLSCIESAPGGQAPTYKKLANDLKTSGYDPSVFVNSNCFIPTISALAMEALSPANNSDLLFEIRKLLNSSNGGTWFDTYAYSSMNLQHIDIEDTLAAWIYGNFQNQTVFVVNDQGQVFSLPDGEHLPYDGGATDIGVTSHGIIWIVSNKPCPGGYITCWYDRDSKQWHELPKTAGAISIVGLGSQSSYALAVNSNGKMLLLDQENHVTPVKSAHKAQDVGSNWNSPTWIISNEQRNRGFAPYWAQMHNPPTSEWHPVSESAAGTRVSVLPNGSAMMVNSAGAVWLVNQDGTGVHYPGVVASDISVGRDGTVWVISDKQRPGGYAPCWLDWTTKQWNELPAPVAAIRIAVL